MSYSDWYKDPIYKVGKTEKKNYWNSWYNFDDFEDSYDSLYKGILDRPKADVNKKLCEDTLRAIVRSANVVLNSGEENERLLNVKFSSGTDVNKPSNNTIFVSPDDLISAKNKEGVGDATDALCGQVMLAAQLKRQIDANTHRKFLAEQDLEVKSLWTAIEFAVARSSIVSEWVGFKPYFDTYARMQSNNAATAMKRMLSSKNGMEGKGTSSKAFIKGLAWNLYNSHDPIRIPSCYNDGKQMIADGLASIRTPKERWKFCVEVVKRIKDLYDEKEEEFYDEEGSSTVEQAFGADLGDNPLSTWDVKFLGVDEGLFGTVPVINKKCLTAKDIESLSGTSGKEAKEAGSAPAVPFHGRDENSITMKPVWCKPDEVLSKHWDLGRIRRMDNSAERLAESFAFSSKELTRKVYGNPSGKLHLGSIYKVAMDSDKVFYRNSSHRSDKIAVNLLIDQSGSMSGNKIQDAAEVGYILAKLCKGVSGLDLSVTGFSAQEGSAEGKVLGVPTFNELTLRQIYDETKPGIQDLHNILKITHHANNTDGFAIWHASKHLAYTREDYKRRIMVVISDGQPNANGYGYESAFQHVNLCRKDARARFGVEVYAIGVAGAYPQSLGDTMYGAGNSIVIQDVMSSIGFIGRFFNQLAEASTC